MSIVIRAFALIGLGCVLAMGASVALFIAAGRHGQERRYPIGDGEPDEPLSIAERLNRLYEPGWAKNGTDEEMRQQ